MCQVFTWLDGLQPSCTLLCLSECASSHHDVVCPERGSAVRQAQAVLQASHFLKTGAHGRCVLHTSTASPFGRSKTTSFPVHSHTPLITLPPDVYGLRPHTKPFSKGRESCSRIEFCDCLSRVSVRSHSLRAQSYRCPHLLWVLMNLWEHLAELGKTLYSCPFILEGTTEEKMGRKGCRVSGPWVYLLPGTPPIQLSRIPPTVSYLFFLMEPSVYRHLQGHHWQ